MYYLYDLAGHVVTEINSSGGWNRGEVYAGGKHLATYVGGTTYFDQGDWLGTERARTDATGAVAETCTGLPFGDDMNCTAGGISPLYFAGKERDTESGNDYFGARYYSSAVGRFLSPDWADKPGPVPYANFGNPQSLNLYTYSSSSPLSRTDPEGHCDIDGERHGALWCFAHALGLAETQHEKADDARNFFENNDVLINGSHVDPSKMTDQQVLAAFQQYNNAYRANGGALSPSGALAGMLPGGGLEYEPNPKHGTAARGGASAEPTNPQQTLENSVPIKNTLTARVGVDPSTGEYVMFRETSPGVYHGYATTNFNDLPNEAKAALQDAGLVSQRGKIR